MADSTTTINPFTEQPIKPYDLLSKAAAEHAIDNADKCFASWKLTSLAKRADLAEKLAKVIEDRQDKLITLMTDEMGKVRSQGVEEVKLCAEICRYTAKQAKSVLADEEREFAQGKAIVTYQPLGVILGIQPWNFPLYQVIRYSITNVVAGNTTVLKHAANVFGMAEEIEAMYLAAGFPAHCYQSLLIDGETASNLISHPKVKGITFTGSDKVGKSVAENAAKLAKKTVLELGSNDAYLVLDDADIELAVETCVKGRIVNNGETCVAAKRFIITEKNYHAFKTAFSSAMSKLKMGDPNDDETDLGPMARSDLRDKIHQQVTESINAGATLVCGGKIPDRTGYFYPPSVLENVKPGMPAYDDELFGPVAVLIKVKDDAQAIEVANDSRYGLGGGIFSKNVENAIELAKKHFDTGMVNINGYSLALPNLPFGGVKDSGYGREHGGFGLREFVNVKSIMVTMNS